MNQFEYIKRMEPVSAMAADKADKRMIEHLAAGGSKLERRLGVVSKNALGEEVVSIYRHCFWTEFYHAELEKLAREHGLR